MRSLFWLILVTAVVMAPNLIFGQGYTHSGTYNYIWTSQFSEAIRAGTLYPRWLPHSFEGLGSPTFYFYPPLAYWLSGGIGAIGFTTLQAISAAEFIVLLASGVTMHLWLKGRSAYPLLGAICYIVAPYHLLDLGVRGALAELTAFLWFPLIALAIERLPTRNGIFLLTGSFAGLLLTHLPMAVLTGIFMIAPLVFWRAKEDKSLWIPAAISGALAIGLVAFYLLPALTLQGHITTKLLWSPYYQPANWIIFDRPDPTLGNVQLIGLGMLLISLSTRSIWTGIAIVTGIAAIGLLPPLWLIPPLDKVQFPWRLLGVTEFVAITAVFTAGKPLRLLFVLPGLGCLIIPYVLLMKQVHKHYEVPQHYEALTPRLPDAIEYLPNGFPYQGTIDNKRAPDLTAYKSLSRASVIEVPEAGAVTLGRAAFPIWRVERDGKVVPSTGPLIRFQATPGTYRIVRVRIWQEIAGAIVSLITLLAALLFWYARRPRNTA